MYKTIPSESDNISKFRHCTFGIPINLHSWIDPGEIGKRRENTGLSKMQYPQFACGQLCQIFMHNISLKLHNHISEN